MSQLVDMPNEKYHATPAISASWLKLLSKSPRHLWHAYINPDRKPSVQTQAMMLGSLTHTLVLEPIKLESEYIIIPEGIDKRTKDGKALFAEIEASGKTPVKQIDFDECKAYADALNADDGFFFTRTCPHVNEKSYFWDDDETGLACKFRPDTLVFPCEPYPNGAITDVKTAVSASPAEFGRQFFNLGYHIQAAHYAIGYMHAIGTDELPDVIFEVVEKSEPYLTMCYTVPESVIEYGLEERARLISIAAECFKTGIWPGYSETMFTPLMVPSYIEREINEAGEIEVSYVE